jgi:hypothetical protein
MKQNPNKTNKRESESLKALLVKLKQTDSFDVGFF